MEALKDSPYQYDPPTVYQPTDEITAVDKFRKMIERKYRVTLDNYWDLHDWSAKNYPQFWEEVWYYFDIKYSQPFTEVVSENRDFGEVEWFKGAALNFTENVFRFRDDRLALILIDEDDNVEKITYAQLYDQVAIYASALKKMGIKKMDRVTCYMSNRKEAVLAFLATVSIGAVWSGSLPLLGAKAILSRFQQIKPKILFTVDRFTYNGIEENMLEKLEEISKGLPTLEKVVIVPSRKTSLDKDLSAIPKSCFLPEFLSLGVHPDGKIPTLEFEQLPFSHPVSISYTSGTTGNPKGLVHSFGSLLPALRDFGLHMNCTRDDVLLSVSPVGWITWNLYTNTLALGLTIVLYEGFPYFHSPTYFWDLVDKFGITNLFVAPSNLEELERRGFKPTAKHSLKKLRMMISGGSPVKPQCFDFVYRDVKPDVCFIALYGSTELLGMLSGLELTVPIHRGELQCFALGIDAKCLDAEGTPVIGQRGEMVIANPFPSLPICIYDDENKAKFNSYITKYKGYWNQNDETWINPKTRGFLVFGRSDETMNPKGARYSSSEIYAVVDPFKEIEDCLCTSQYNSKGDERTVLFLKMKTGCTFSETLVQNIRAAIAKELTVRHIPEIILEIKDIPYNLNSKKMELIVKQLINGKPVPNRHVIINQGSLDLYKNIPELQNF